MTDFVRLGVFGEGRFLKAKTFASGMDIFPFVHTTPKKSTVSLAMFGLVGGRRVQRRYSLTETTLQQGKFEGYGSHTCLTFYLQHNFNDSVI